MEAERATMLEVVNGIKWAMAIFAAFLISNAAAEWLLTLLRQHFTP